jgi:very-short-patch-repair endonuclease
MKINVIIVLIRVLLLIMSKTVNGKLKVDCWHPTKNGELTPRQVTKCSGKKYWFQCDVCNHDFDSVISQCIKENRWCSYCANQKLCDEDECSYCFNKSFASYNEKTVNGKLKVDCWHHTKNGELNTKTILLNNLIKNIGFNVMYVIMILIVSLYQCIKENRWCPYCANQKLCDEDKCNHCFNKSFASYDGKTENGKLKVDCWHHTKNGELTPRDVTKGTDKKCWFQCDVCNHDFDSRIASVSGSNNGWCPYCKNKKLCDEDECSHCFNKSFASYDKKTVNGKLKVDCWHHTKNGELTPRDVTKGTDKKCWFQCDVCNHDFDSRIASVSGSNNRWCPYCKNKTELKLYNWLLKQPNIKNVKREYQPKWCSTKYKYINKKKELKERRYQYRYDFLITFINKKKLIIELDGAQHYKQVMNWKKPLENQIRDKYKEFLANKHKILLTRCIQEDVYMDRNNWEQKLKRKLQKYN